MSKAAGDLAGQQLGRYRIVSFLGAGGMGRVYRAIDSTLGRAVAIKVLPPEVVDDREKLQRFVREARTASALNHPNVVTIYEIGEDGGTHFIAMELLEGETLRNRIVRSDKDVTRAIEIVAQVADGLAAAHAARVVHRDLKPENIMVTSSGYAKVLDFGLAKLRHEAGRASEDEDTDVLLTAPGVVLGTAGYMSPEQARGKPADHRTDIFALGCILYELLSSRSAFRGESSVDTLHKIIHESPTPLIGVPAELQRIINKCLAKDPDERYQSARELAIDLRNLRRAMDSQPHRAVTRRQWPVWIGVLMIAILAAAAIVIVRRSSAPPNQPVRTLAVLPFRPLAGGADEQFLGVAMADALITRLAQIHHLVVRPTSSVLKYAGAATDPLVAAREQGVETVVDGRVQHVGDRIRVSVQLLRVGDGSSLWADQFDERFNDVFALQDAISERVAGALVARLTGEERNRLTRRYTADVDAYQLYVRGRFLWERRTVESLKKSIEYYQQAIARDPRYALAYAGIADSYNMLGTFSVLPPDEAYPRAKAAAAKALEIDSTLAPAEIAQSFATYLYDHDWDTAERGFRHGLAENPNYGPGHQWFAVCLVSRQRSEEARAEIQRALRVDPTSLTINAVVAWINYLSHDPQAAIAAAKRAIEMDPNFSLSHMYLAEAYATLGRYEDSAEEFEKGGALLGKTHRGYLGFVLCRAGRSDQARTILADIENLSQHEYISPYHAALINLGLGNKEKAIDLLERAADQHYPWVVHYNVEPVLDALRDEPRFKQLLRRLGLPEVRK